MDYDDLIAKLRRIEALHAAATTPGERVAASNARQRILDRLGVTQREQPAVEMKFSIGDPWGRKLFIALCQRYGLDPYRRKGQHAQTVMLRVPRRFSDETLWPEYVALVDELYGYLHAMTDRVIRDGIYGRAEGAATPRAGKKA